MCGHEAAIEEYRGIFENYKLLLQKLNHKIEEEKQLKKDFDYFQFQWQEIEDLQLKQVS
jgi:DNA repair ATPase RecN